MTAAAEAIDWIEADWPAPAGVRAGVTGRSGGVSAGVYRGLNLAGHVGDMPARVAANRTLLGQRLGLAEPICWLDQVHGNRVVELPGGPLETTADAAFCARPGVVCAVLTADCLPLVLCNDEGTEVAAVHAGWRGIKAGVIAAAVTRFQAGGERLLAWLGPAIGVAAYEVGAEFREAFLRWDARAEPAFRQRAGCWHADLRVLAGISLAAAGVSRISTFDACTHDDAQRFFSYRRDGTCGRNATLIWID